MTKDSDNPFAFLDGIKSKLVFESNERLRNSALLFLQEMELKKFSALLNWMEEVTGCLLYLNALPEHYKKDLLLSLQTFQSVQRQKPDLNFSFETKNYTTEDMKTSGKLLVSSEKLNPKNP